MVTKNSTHKQITEKTLGITGNYQYQAIRSHNFFQSNWHHNKWLVVEKLLTTYQPKNVLDLGTGSGNFELGFHSRIKNIVGVDYNEVSAFVILEKLLGEYGHMA